MSAGEDTYIPPPRPTGERLARLESKASECRKQHERVREDLRAFFKRHDSQDQAESAQRVVVESLAKDVKTLKTTQTKHAMILYAGYVLLGLAALLFKMFGRDLVARMAGG